MKHIGFTVVLTLALYASGIAQKVKYKDLFILLKAENYEVADPYIRLFLDSKPDHPNANYHMGKMFQRYMLDEDLINHQDDVILMADSSLTFYDNALKYITEKDVKKHDDDYYAEFKRRDMRTGKFDVKFNDVQLDI